MAAASEGDSGAKRTREEEDFKASSPDAIQELLAQHNPNARIDPTAANLLCTMTEEFLDVLVATSAKLARHRGNSTVEAKDVELALGEDWGMVLTESKLEQSQNAPKKAKH
eukprot:gnl/MRDRNA2_/MRDRNA2_73433_c0_seq1.p1 gnl/MRDRNA2_/MRDRNA2_73433_c0~~gnl/MRDRNA2_/MRDRNA2_73433_c0_seq1.p1  ORF type:complete len:111 (+),score=38.13 gnl/MRDRNA2_/MRDRNA2_73433_c0_seq1:91-423(+)